MSTLKGIPPLEPRERLKRKRERIAILFLLILFVVLMVVEFRISKVSSTLPFVNSIFFFGLVNLNIIILITLLWLVLRNISKLFIERRRNILGSKLKTKLVISFLSFSIIPTLVLFVISALYINTTFDKWFSIKIQNTLQASLEITRVYYRGADQAANHFAEHLSHGVAKKFSMGRVNRDKLSTYLEEQRSLLALDAVEFYFDPLQKRVLAQKNFEEENVSVPPLTLDLLDEVFLGNSTSLVQPVGHGDLVRAIIPVRRSPSASVEGALVVSRYVPITLVDKVDEISSVIDDYKDINPLKYPVKTAYFLILIMITLTMIFVAIWVGLYMAKELTTPVERLVRGAQAVGAGNLNVTIQGVGHDEISVLVDSFNKMTRDLRVNQERLTEASKDLEKRKLQLEAVLANVGTGVISVDQSGVITTFNRAASQLLGIDSKEALGKCFREVFIHELQPFLETFEKINGGTVIPLHSPWVTQLSVRLKNEVKSIASIATPLPTGGVVVIDDMTYLVRGQREMAWREVARRIAHEIKNPLTPIKLSAQRLQRKLTDLTGKDGQLLKECTTTIIQHTDALKEMVNEFSSFARMPEINPSLNSLDEILQETLLLYVQAHSDIQIQYQANPSVPAFEFDRDQIKRVFINLFDNAVAAVADQNVQKAKLIEIQTRFYEDLKLVVIDFKDNGIGMTEESKNRIFEPYFSTKENGTGLGLAIAKRIISDHHGFIRVQSQLNQGTQFTIELPTVSQSKVERS